ncbi:hypothetical protein F5Y03DRAFT_349665 [Xylaria venustula]|nr:hypothetical protein F5Y03DRAFT_349665 [Xylaria venustula]
MQSPTIMSNRPTCVEVQGRWIAECIAKIDKNKIKYINPKPEVAKAWKEHIAGMCHRTLIPTARSTYIGGSIPGKVKEPVCYMAGIPQYATEIRAAILWMDSRRL